MFQLSGVHYIPRHSAAPSLLPGPPRGRQRARPAHVPPGSGANGILGLGFRVYLMGSPEGFSASGYGVYTRFEGLPGPQKYVESMAFFRFWAIILPTFGGFRV